MSAQKLKPLSWYWQILFSPSSSQTPVWPHYLYNKSSQSGHWTHIGKPSLLFWLLSYSDFYQLNRIVYVLLSTQHIQLHARLCVGVGSVVCNSLQPHGLEPGCSVHGTFPARILERVAISSSRGSSWTRDRTCISCISCIAGRFFTTEPPRKLMC